MANPEKNVACWQCKVIYSTKLHNNCPACHAENSWKEQEPAKVVPIDKDRLETVAEAKAMLDEADNFVVLTEGKDGVISRNCNYSDAGRITMLGALDYQAHRIRQQLDEAKEEEEG